MRWYLGAVLVLMVALVFRLGLLAGIVIAGSISAAPVMLPNVPDFFQHQGLRFNPEPYPNFWNPGTGFNWETGGGWCRNGE